MLNEHPGQVVAVAQAVVGGVERYLMRRLHSIHYGPHVAGCAAVLRCSAQTRNRKQIDIRTFAYQSEFMRTH